MVKKFTITICRVLCNSNANLGISFEMINFASLEYRKMVIEITDIGDDRVSDYARLTEAELRDRLNPGNARIIVESPKVIEVALDCGMLPLSILCERRHIEGDAANIISRSRAIKEDSGKSHEYKDRALCKNREVRKPDTANEVNVYTADRATLADLTGYTLTRGVLAAFPRPEQPGLHEILEGARRVCILDGVCDSTNIGAIFRSAAALGMDAVLLTGTCCDPYNRRAIRVSMGSVFLVPWCRIASLEEVRKEGFRTVAMALRHDSISLDDLRLRDEPKLAIIMGTEGDGLAMDVILSADFVVKIPMHHGVDSLNVAAASAVAFWELSKAGRDSTFTCEG